MDDTNAIPWAGLAIMAATMAAVIGLVLLVRLVVVVFFSARDALREHYFDGRWNPHAMDLVVVPLWIGLEVVCLITGIVLGALMALADYGLACTVRDWWHAGDRGR